MTDSFEIEVEGIKSLKADLKALGNDLEDIPTMDDVSLAYVNIVSSIAPKKSGYLASTLQPSNKDNMAGITSPAKYASAVNYGSPARNKTAVNFISKADQILAQRTLAIIEAGVDQAIGKRDLDA